MTDYTMNDEEIVVEKATKLGHVLRYDEYGLYTSEDEFGEHPSVHCIKCDWFDCIYCITIYKHEIPKCVPSK